MEIELLMLAVDWWQINMPTDPQFLNLNPCDHELLVSTSTNILGLKSCKTDGPISQQLEDIQLNLISVLLSCIPNTCLQISQFWDGG